MSRFPLPEVQQEGKRRGKRNSNCSSLFLLDHNLIAIIFSHSLPAEAYNLNAHLILSLCMCMPDAMILLRRLVTSLLEDLSDCLATLDNSLNLFLYEVAIRQYPASGGKERTHKSLNGTQGIPSRLQNSNKSESPFAICFANSTSACLAALKSETPSPQKKRVGLCARSRYGKMAFDLSWPYPLSGCR